MKYKVIATTTYGKTPRSYMVDEFDRLADARKCIKERCYTTISRTFHIEDLKGNIK